MSNEAPLAATEIAHELMVIAQTAPERLALVVSHWADPRSAEGQVYCALALQSALLVRWVAKESASPVDSVLQTLRETLTLAQMEEEIDPS